jgi:hypothetical protein
MSVTESVTDLLGWTIRAHQATGMITVQLDCDVMTAARRLADYGVQSRLQPQPIR